MLSQPYAEDIRDIVTEETVTVQVAVIDAGAGFDLASLARLFGEVPADQYDPGYGSAGTSDWYIPARNSYSCGEPHSSGELLIRFGR